MAAPVAKICVKCGKDVAALRRMKDAQGRYICGDCHDAMMAAVLTRGQPDHAVVPGPPSGDAPRPDRGSERPVSSQRDLVHVAAPALATEINRGGPTCPCCHRQLAPQSTICVSCGIKVPSGRPMITALGRDEDLLYTNAQAIIKVLAWFVWVGFYPLASEAFATRKPIVIWSIAAVTTVSSIWWALAVNGDPENKQLKQWMLWPVARQVTDAEILDLYHRHESDRYGAALRKLADLTQEPGPDTELDQRIIKAFREVHLDRPRGEFKSYQLLTNTLLHDPSSVWHFALHLGGNMLFLLIFGTRVNALVGNLKMLILYPALAALASAAQILFTHDAIAVPVLGASGAIMGLAGMYLIFFPVHRVYMAFWVPMWMRIWPMRGFWVLAFYLAFDVVGTLLRSADGVAHWAHLGGFIAGAILAVAMLLLRIQDAHHGDLLSMILGRHAWALIGKPQRALRRTVVDGQPTWG
jgi:membrane associated rhomboid family serine protease